MINRKIERTARVAFFSVIHEIYFEQFEGLEESFNRYHKDTIDLISSNNVEVVDFGIVGSNSISYQIAEDINKANVDLIFCNMITYATSSVFAPIVMNTKAPIIMLALQPRMAMDYTKASTFMQLENDNTGTAGSYDSAVF